jgi:hypothetical protein
MSKQIEKEFSPEDVSVSPTFRKWLARDGAKARDTGWGTEDELAFLVGLGTFSPHKVSQERLLDGYARAIAKRVNWGRIDEVQVRTALALMRP